MTNKVDTSSHGEGQFKSESDSTVREKREAEGLKVMTKCVVQAYRQRELVILVAKFNQFIVFCVSLPFVAFFIL